MILAPDDPLAVEAADVVAWLASIGGVSASR